MTKLFLFDIEGTTTDINFVHKVLFPYSAEHLPSFLRQHENEPVIAKGISDVRETVKKEEGRELSSDEVIATLLKWIKEDRKHGALKEIQGHIWDIGYSKNHFRGHVYSDVEPAFKKILGYGAKIGIYSSGSVHAQKLIFGFSEAGDLTPMISYYFDTKVGAKRDVNSYKSIAEATGLPASDIHFFSDIQEELAAAQTAGMQVTQVLRPGTKPSAFSALSDLSSLL